MYVLGDLEFAIINNITDSRYKNEFSTGLTIGAKRYYLSFQETAINVSSTIRHGTNGLLATNESVGCNISPIMTAIPFLGSDDYNLFASGQVGLVKNAIDVKYRYFNKSWGNSEGSSPIDPTTQKDSRNWNRKELTTKQAITINVDAQDIQDIKINHYISRNEIQETFDSTNEGDISLEIYANGNSVNWNYWNQVSITQEILLNRSLRIAEYITPPDYVQLETIEEKQKRTTPSNQDGEKLINDAIKKQVELDNEMEFIYV